MTGKPLDGHHALVTGAGSGIGAATALALARAGARVSLAGRRRAPLEDVARVMPQASAVVVDSFDVTSEAAVSDGLERARNALGPVTILVNNAGEAPSAPFEKTDPGLWSRVLAVNLNGAYLVSHAVVSDLKDARRRRAAHQYRVDRGPRRLRLCLRLLRGEARPHWPHAGAGARIRQDRNHGQRGMPRLYRDAPRSGRYRNHCREDRPIGRSSQGRADQVQSARPSGQA